MLINLTRHSEIERTHRVQMLETMFEVPSETKLAIALSGQLPIEERNWNIGLIVGPSGSGKTLLLNELFGQPTKLEWNSKSVIDDFPDHISMEVIARVCQSVGFNTIPSWLRPYSVLSNGEKFRSEIARTLLSTSPIIVVDEFTSVVDRQVATITSHAVAKYIRENNRQFVAASCHYDIIDWLQPDWILEPGNPCRFSWRSLRQRPPITVSVSRVKYETWNLFKDFHYMSQDLNKAARCYGLFVKGTTGVDNRLHEDVVLSSSNRGVGDDGTNSGLRIPPRLGVPNCGADSELVPGAEDEQSVATGNEQKRLGDESDETTSVSETTTMATTVHGHRSTRNLSEHIHQTNRIASMCGVLYRPHPKVADIVGFSRMVTLPDFQGLGLAFVLANTVAAAYKALGKRLHSYPNHPAWIRSYQRSSMWMQVKTAGNFSPRAGGSSTVGGFGGRRCAVFMYVGPASSVEEATKLIHPEET